MESGKITSASEAARRRWYEDACGTAHALELVGERWSLLVVRELILGPRRFSELRANLPGISANVLTQRLEGMEAEGVLTRRKLPPPASVQVYELTPWGYEAEPIFQALGRWAARSPSHDPSLPISAVSLMLSFRTMLDPARARGLEAVIAFRVGAETYAGWLGDGELAIERTDPPSPDLTIEGAPTAIAAWVYGGVPVAGLEAEGAVRLEGDRKLAERFPKLFPLPAKVDAA